MESLFCAGLTIYICARWGLFGHTKITIPKEDQNGCNSYGKNWFTVQNGLFFNNAVEMEEWASGREYQVMSYGSSIKPIKIVYD